MSDVTVISSYCQIKKTPSSLSFAEYIDTAFILILL